MGEASVKALAPVRSLTQLVIAKVLDWLEGLVNL